MIREVCNGKEEIFPYIARVPSKMHDKMPLILQLHGAGERGDGSDEKIGLVEKHGFAHHVFTDDAEIDCVLVQPQCKVDSFWVAHIQELKAFIYQLVYKYNIDKNRIYLTGLSMGGHGTWFTASAFPKMFAAIAPCCGGGMAFMASALDMPVWAFHGTEDTIVLPSNSIDMINAINKVGKNPNVKLTLSDGIGHNEWDIAYRQELLDWLLSQERK